MIVHLMTSLLGMVPREMVTLDFVPCGPTRAMMTRLMSILA